MNYYPEQLREDIQQLVIILHSEPTKSLRVEGNLLTGNFRFTIYHYGQLLKSYPKKFINQVTIHYNSL